MTRSQFRSCFIVGAVCALTGAALVKWPSAHADKLRKVDVAPEGAAALPIAPATVPDAKLMNRIAELERRLNHEPPAPRPQVAEPHQVKSLEEQARESREREAALQGRLEGALELQTRDEAWASGFEAALRTKLSAEEFSGVRVEEIACKRSLCRLRVHHEFAESRDEFPFLFMAQGPSRSEIDGTWAREDLQGSETTIYVSRAGTQALYGLEHEPGGP